MSTSTSSIRRGVLWAFSNFYPTTVEIVSRLLHLDDLVLVCRVVEELCDDGLLTKHRAVDSQLCLACTFGPTVEGTATVAREGTTHVLNSTKRYIFRDLTLKELKMSRIRQCVLGVLARSPLGLSVYRVCADAEVRACTIAVSRIHDVHSALFGMLCLDRVVMCGPLFFDCPCPTPSGS